MTVLLEPPDDRPPAEVTIDDLRVDPVLGELDGLSHDIADVVTVAITPADGRIVANDVFNRFGLLDYCVS